MPFEARCLQLITDVASKAIFTRQVDAQGRTGFQRVSDAAARQRNALLRILPSVVDKTAINIKTFWSNFLLAIIRYAR
jgi:hypothetical protein